MPVDTVLLCINFDLLSAQRLNRRQLSSLAGRVNAEKQPNTAGECQCQQDHPGFLIDQDGFDHRLSRHQLDVGAAGLGFRVGRDVKGQGFGPNLPPPSSLPA